MYAAANSPKVIIFTAPSGSGKTTLVRYLLEQLPCLMFSVSATTRARRSYEQDGKDYYFLSPEEFAQKLADNEFLEWEEVYKNKWYGTLKSEVERIHHLNKYCIFDVDVQGALSIKKYYGNDALSVFVKVPNLEVLRQRLMARHTETPENLDTRLQKAAEEIQFASLFDVVIINDELEKAKAEALNLVIQFLETPCEKLCEE
ncbi:MAG: guanylate kinase [Chitinophagales bacterium]|nr:guanylate kinase [Bacteroidota bacterium]